MQFVIFSDLDGSLLNDGDYSFTDALPALERIKAAGIPLILTTSKTRSEVEIIMDEMGLEEPFIVENGAALYLPPGYRGWDIASMYSVIRLGMPYERIRAFVEKTAPQFKIRGFGDWSVQEVADRTGLPLDRARLAKERDFTEPFLFETDEDFEHLDALASEKDIKIVRGGRFHHLMGSHQDKGEAVKIARNIFRRRMEGKLHFVGIGDGSNDIPMLEQVDHPVLLPHTDGSYEQVELPNLIKAAQPGSRGWNDAVESILNEKELL